jgi:hypothetical protein
MRNIHPIGFPFAAIDKRAEMINRQQKRKSKTDKRKNNKNSRVKIGLGYPTYNSQSKKQDVDRTKAIQHRKQKKKLGYVSLLFPKRYEIFHGLSPPILTAAHTGHLGTH